MLEYGFIEGLNELKMQSLALCKEREREGEKNVSWSIAETCGCMIFIGNGHYSEWNKWKAYNFQ